MDKKSFLASTFLLCSYFGSSQGPQRPIFFNLFFGNKYYWVKKLRRAGPTLILEVYLSESFFYNLVARNSTLKVNKWDDQSLNFNLCIYNIMSQSSDLSSENLREFFIIERLFISTNILGLSNNYTYNKHF
jgi:hypothetical protein